MIGRPSDNFPAVSDVHDVGGNMHVYSCPYHHQKCGQHIREMMGANTIVVIDPLNDERQCYICHLTGERAHG